MDNLKKIGLTALGTALVASSAHAATMDVTGSTSIFFNGEDNSDMGNGWAMTDSIFFKASGEMDNGFTVSTSIELDAAGTNGTGAGADRSIAIDFGDMGKLTFSGDGGSGPIGAWDDVTPSANEEAHGVAISGTATSPTTDAADDNIFIFDYTAMEGLALKASYTPSNTTASIKSSSEVGALYTGIDGLSVYAAMGENNDTANNADLSNFAVKYAMGAITVGYQNNEVDYGTGTSDRDFTALGVSYAVSDDLSVSFNQSTVDYEASTSDDQEATGVSFSYTSGGLTVSATHSTIDNVAGTSTADNTGYEVNFIFAF
tara:strand:+ start:420 stop:1367 length:948 start_codon:yes stop_codon:yes gene_type:complete